jgi:hypothetical protein
MKKILFIFVLIISVSGVSGVSAQTIRKPWSELTLSERSDYVSAINSLTKSQVQNLANEHRRLFNLGIHGTTQFLPWHRIFLEYFEGLLQSIDPDVTIPYWNWHNTWSSSSLLFQNGSAQNTGLLGYNVNGSIWEDPEEDTMFNRGFTAESQPSDSYKNQTIFSSFSSSLQGGAHNAGHRFVGGDMVETYSPIDPVFYLHHCMVDKVWADWFREHPSSTGSGLNTSMRTFNGYPGFPNTTVDATDWVNPRSQKLWYAHDNLLLLDNYTASGTEVYYYSTGSIEVDDFTIPSTADVEFRTEGNTITIEKDFEVAAGAELLITTDGN